jgi:predicted HicB family RNase H-like nuclease
LKKLIDIPGDLKDEDSVAHKLNVLAAKAGVSLNQYIKNVLTDHVDSFINC